jgi:hypothetical protein
MSTVTDHAVLRYLQRHHGIDVEGIRASMNVHGIDVAAEFGCATVKLGNGVRMALKGDVACTCFEARKRRRIWRAQVGRQMEALLSDADIIGYGGAAGGGKTDLIAGLALTSTSGR